MSDPHNPLGREYTPEEWAAAKRVGLTTTGRTVINGEMLKVPAGPMVYATGPWHPDHARDEARKALKAAADWQTVEKAMRREWKKEQ